MFSILVWHMPNLQKEFADGKFFKLQIEAQWTAWFYMRTVKLYTCAALNTWCGYIKASLKTVETFPESANFIRSWPLINFIQIEIIAILKCGGLKVSFLCM